MVLRLTGSKTVAQPSLRSPKAVSPREFALLAALLARPGVILSRAQLEDKLYGWSDPVESNAVEVHIHSLRKKLGADFIRNVRGVGWMVARGSAAATAASVRVHTEGAAGPTQGAISTTA